jgi:hypothetical protein
MKNNFFKSIVSSIHTATTGYLTPKRQSKPIFNHPETSSPEIPPSNHTIMAHDSTGRKEIFKDIVYYDASSALNEQHRKVLQIGGAVEYAGDRDVVDWSKITHVFTNDLDFPGRQEAINHERLVIITVRYTSRDELICSSQGGLKSLHGEQFFRSPLLFELLD